MSKEFIVNRSGSTPTLDPVQESKIKIYPTEADLDADLANLEENEIVATDEDNNPASGTQYPVDVVQDGNMHAVTSNAVANKCCRFPDYAHRITITGTSWVATEDCYISLMQLFDSSATIQHFSIDGVQVTNKDSQGSLTVLSFSGYVKKGQTVSYGYLSYSSLCKIYPLI